jgi:hypothetical protein
MCEHGGFITVGSDVGDVALLLQPVVDEAGHLRVVFDYEQLHGDKSVEGVVKGSTTRCEDPFRLRWKEPRG